MQQHSEAFLRIMRKRRRKKIRNRIIAVTAIIVGASIVFFAITSRTEPKSEQHKEHESDSETQIEEEEIVPTVHSTDRILETTPVRSTDWDADESYLLARIAMAEAEGEDTEGKALVMCVVINRVWDSRFPNTIKDVIYQDGAFTSISNGRYDRVEPDEDCFKALHMVQVEHWDESQGALYFERPPEDGRSTWHSRNLEKLFAHGNHTFYTERGDSE